MTQPANPHLLETLDHGALVSYVARLVGPDDAEDVVQSAYVQILSTSAPFRGESSYKTWVYTVARNLAYTFLQKQRRRPPHDLLSDLVGSTSPMVDHLDLDRALSHLKPAYAEIIHGRLTHDSIASVAESLGLTYAAARMRYTRAVEALRQILVEEPTR